MKKLTLIFVFACICNFTFAQQNVFPNNGNVGIGTSNPSVKLDVN